MKFKMEYDFLNNMYDCKIVFKIGNAVYRFNNLESAFQALKDPLNARNFINTNGATAKKTAELVNLRNDWEEVKVDLMKELLLTKFILNPDLKQKLLLIQENITYENDCGDTFWGVVNGVGSNVLGILLMEVRNILSTKDTICFTGRRPKDLFGYNHGSYIPMVDKLKNDLRNLYYSNNYKRFISGGAQGFDQLAFWAVNALKREGLKDIKNVIYVPFPTQASRWQKSGLFSQKEYNLAINLADEVYYLDIIDGNNMKDVVNALYTRNHYMVNDSDIVYGLYPNCNWQDSKTKGGTSECLRYARDNNKKIFQISPDTLTLVFQTLQH